MDDGQVLCRPGDADNILIHLDRELAKIGASRGEGSDVKSIARILGSEQAVRELKDWPSPQVARTCKCPNANSDAHILGIDLEEDLSSTV